MKPFYVVSVLTDKWSPIVGEDTDNNISGKVAYIGALADMLKDD